MYKDVSGICQTVLCLDDVFLCITRMNHHRYCGISVHILSTTELSMWLMSAETITCGANLALSINSWLGETSRFLPADHTVILSADRWVDVKHLFVCEKDLFACRHWQSTQQTFAVFQSLLLCCCFNNLCWHVTKRQQWQVVLGNSSCRSFTDIQVTGYASHTFAFFLIDLPVSKANRRHFQYCQPFLRSVVVHCQAFTE